MYGVADVFGDGGADGFGDADDVTDIAVIVFDAHVDDASLVGGIIKCGVNADASASEFFADVPGEDEVCAAFAAGSVDDGVKGIAFLVRAAHDLPQWLAFGQLIDELVHDADVFHQRILDVFDAYAADRAGHFPAVGMDLCLDEKIAQGRLLLQMLFQLRFAVSA